MLDTLVLKTFRCCLLTLAVLGLANVFRVWPAFAQDMAELEVDHALTFDFQTPHTKWAQPYALGKIRVLFFTDGTGTNPRECVELMQRFDIEGQAVFWARIVDSNDSHWHGGEVGELRMSKLLDQKWDCFVFLRLPMTNVPPEQKQKIIMAVNEGAGIVFVGSDDDTLLNQNNRLSELPPFLAAEPVSDAYRIAKGRGVRAPNPPEIQFHEGWEAEYDWQEERLGRAVLWAAGKEPVSRLEMSLSSTDPGANGSGSFSITMHGKAIGEKPNLYLSIRCPGHDPIELPARDIALDKPFVLQIPWLSEGAWHADARVISSAGVETWATIPLEIKHDRRIAGITLDQTWGEPGGAISGHVALEGKPLLSEILRVQLLDHRRRELVRKDIDPAGDSSSFPFTFEIAEWLPMLTTVEARLMSDGREYSRSYQYFHVTKRKQGRFNFLMWDVPKGTLAPYAEEALAKTGVTLQLAWGNPPLYAAASEISWVPYTTHIDVKKSPQGIMQPFCWNDSNAVTKYISHLASKHGGSREHGAFVYSLGDENDTRGSCLSPHCLEAYRDYLRQSYGSLAALNASWGTSFTSWRQVGLSREGDDEESNSLKENNYPRWFDRQAFKSWNYVQYCRKYADAFKAMDPSAKTGFEGAGSFTKGDDLDLIVRSLDFWSPYEGPAHEVIRSIAPRDFVRSTWMGYTKDAGSLLRNYWRMVTLGMDSAWWWRWDCIGKFYGWLAPDLRPFPAVKELLDDTQIVRDGLGDLLLRSEMQDDGIAILYSYPSVFANKLEAGPSYGTYEQAHKDATKLVRGRGLQFRYVTDRMLRLGEFDISRYKLLILPCTEAIGDKEAEVIRDFAFHGGTVVADLRPGIYDDHCKPRSQGAVDHLFGIKRVARTEARVLTKTARNAQIKILVDPGVELAGGSAERQIDGVPLFISKNVGKGKAILLNCGLGMLEQLTSALESSSGGEQASPAHMIPEIFAGIEPAVQLRNQRGEWPKNVAVTRWRNGDMDIISLFGEGAPDEELTVILPRPRYVHDLRNRKAFGREASFAATILSNRASFFALTSKPVSAPKITLEKDHAAAGDLVKLMLCPPGAEGLYAFHLRARLADRDIQWFDRLVITGREQQEISLPLAYNDPQGKHQIVATDLLTNESTASEMSVAGDR